MSGKISYLGKVRGGGNIVNDNSLVLCLDSANVKSYPGSGTSWLDLSKKGTVSTLQGGVTFASNNKGALNFNGTNGRAFIGTNSNYYFNLTQNFTLCAWIKPSAIQFSGIISRYNLGVAGNYYMTLEPGAMIYFHRERTPFTKAQSSTLLVPGNTYYVVGVYNGVNMQIYINGLVDGTPVTSGSITANQSGINLYIGCWQRSNAATDFFPGDIYFVKIYNRALADWEILKNYNAMKYRFNY